MIKRILKNRTAAAAVGVAVIAVLALLLIVVPARGRAETLGRGVGSAAGKAAGVAAGAAGAFLSGEGDYWQGRESGAADGLSARDTRARLSSVLAGTGKLRVLAAGLALDDFHSVGDKYRALYLMSGEAIFTVDLSLARIDVENQVIYIPEPEGRLDIDESKTQKAAEWERKYFLGIGGGSTEAGLTAYHNAMAELREKAEAEVKSDSNLYKQAEAAALEQIGELTRQITGVKYTVEFGA